MKKNYCLFLVALLTPILSEAQIVYSNGATFSIGSGAVVFVNGGVNMANASSFSNNGDITITKNSNLPLAGSFNIENSSSVSGNGNYEVEQDWINSALFVAGNSTVKLFGNTQQFITSNNGTITTFNNLELVGSGVGVNRKKTLSGVDAKTGPSGNLAINDRELETQTQTFFILNTGVTAVTNNTTPGSEGFVSSLNPGTFSRETNSNGVYLFPTGSSNGILRYRPVELTPTNANSNTYVARLNNVDATTQGFSRSLTDGNECDLNPLFFHSINRITGTSSTDVRLFYNVSADGDWSGMGQWQTGNTQWNDMVALGTGTSGTFNTRTRSAWNFVNPGDPYILTNVRPATPIVNCPSLCENSNNNIFTLAGSSSAYQWTFPSNGTIISGQGTSTVNASWTTGTGTVSVIAIGVGGCNSLPGTCEPVVVPPPTVVFMHEDDLNDVAFTDQTNGATQWDWNFGDGNMSNSQNPLHTYPGSGTYTVVLNVSNATGCTNSGVQIIEIGEEIIVPNVITPNGDGFNDVFTIKTHGLQSYELTILNRWGTKVFTSTSALNHWDGKVNGNLVPSGVYFYILNVTRATKQLEFHGNVTVFN
ncbi:MAG: gliding motility-associated C-terminal domain-containing protein [Bacteroidota bacterium]